jgi:hypothetical protein
MSEPVMCFDDPLRFYGPARQAVLSDLRHSSPRPWGCRPPCRWRHWYCSAGTGLPQTLLPERADSWMSQPSQQPSSSHSHRLVWLATGSMWQRPGSNRVNATSTRFRAGGVPGLAVTAGTGVVAVMGRAVDVRPAPGGQAAANCQGDGSTLCEPAVPNCGIDPRFPGSALRPSARTRVPPDAG